MPSVGSSCNAESLSDIILYNGRINLEAESIYPVRFGCGYARGSLRGVRLTLDVEMAMGTRYSKPGRFLLY
jgi:hypothetical protein